MPIEKSEILRALSYVDDPDLKQDLVTLNMVKNVAIEENKVEIEIELTTPMCPLQGKIEQDIRASIAEEIKAEIDLKIEFTSQVTSIRDSEEILKGVKNIIVVASGKGGVGKSTISVNLAVGLAAAGAKVGLIDADIHGPSIPTMLDLKTARPGVIEVEGKNKILPVEKFGLKILSIGFMADERQAIVWRGPMVSSALKQFIVDAVWGELDYLVLDLPPGTGDVHLTLAQIVPITGAVIVTTPQDVAVADVRKAFGMFKLPQIDIPVLGIVENMAYFSPPEMPDQKYYIFGKGGGERLAAEYDVPLLAQIPMVEPIAFDCDQGTPAILDEKNEQIKNALTNFVENVARRIAIKNFETAKEKVES